MSGLEGRVALVTGCGSAGGIGFAIARALVGAGARVAITATTARIHDRQRDLGAAFAGIADLTDPTQVARLFAEVRAALGPVEVLVNNAGMVQTGQSLRRSGVEGLSDATWAAHLAINVTTAFHCIREALPAMQAAAWGRIVASTSCKASSNGITAQHNASRPASILLKSSMSLINSSKCNESR